jgi:hypothetical protein
MRNLEENVAVLVSQRQEIACDSIIRESCHVDVARINEVLVNVDVIAMAAQSTQSPCIDELFD